MLLISKQYNLKLNIITGNKGFVGGNLEKYLKLKNKQIKGVSRKPLEDEVSYKNLTLETINKSRSFIHLAGKAHDLKNISEDSIYFEVNTELTKKLFDQLRLLN